MPLYVEEDETFKELYCVGKEGRMLCYPTREMATSAIPSIAEHIMPIQPTRTRVLAVDEVIRFKNVKSHVRSGIGYLFVEVEPIDEKHVLKIEEDEVGNPTIVSVSRESAKLEQATG
jgi:hypothetical protein